MRGLLDATKRFSSRAENYDKYRPGYPAALIGLLRRECGLGERTVVADLGSGTGILTELLLEAAGTVYGIEPNPQMREAAAKRLQARKTFRSVDATAEATTLPDRSVDLITAAQAFHWFNRETAAREFRRILRPRGWLALIWNERDDASSPFLREYESLLRKYSIDYAKVGHRHTDVATVAPFFAPGKVEHATFPNAQICDLEAVKGRLKSSSYTPEEGDARYGPMLEELKRIFQKHQQNGVVDFIYSTSVFYGRLDE